MAPSTYDYLVHLILRVITIVGGPPETKICPESGGIIKPPRGESEGLVRSPFHQLIGLAYSYRPITSPGQSSGFQ